VHARRGKSRRASEPNSQRPLRLGPVIVSGVGVGVVGTGVGFGFGFAVAGGLGELGAALGIAVGSGVGGRAEGTAAGRSSFNAGLKRSVEWHSSHCFENLSWPGNLDFS
jgi:hypothetical protein